MQLNELFTHAVATYPAPTEGHGWGKGPSGDALHWGGAFRALLDNPRVSPIIQELFGGSASDAVPNFRIDHINVHSWCNPRFIAEHPEYAANSSTLHGGASADGQPVLPPTNSRSRNGGDGNNQFFRVEPDGSFRNGLVSATFELTDTTENGGGFCCVSCADRCGPA